MRMYRRLAGLIFLIVSGYKNVSAQELTIGDTLPDVVFQSVLRYPSELLRLRDYRGKVLVLDLWRTTCSHAVASFVHFDSLRKEFPGQFEALGITVEDREPIRQYIANNVMAKETEMPVITNDTSLAGKHFSFVYIPHVVVVNTDGRIAAIANPEQVTADFIRSLLSGRAFKLPLKKELTDFNYAIPVVAEGNGRNMDSLVYTSTIMHRLPGVRPADSYDTSGNRLVYYAYNESIPELYAKVFHQLFDKNKLVLNVKDISRFTNANYDDEAWQNKNLWCYNLILPQGYLHPEQFAIRDLDRFFGVHCTPEWRSVQCMVIVKKGNGERWRTKDSTGEHYDITENGVRKMHNLFLGTLASALNFESPKLIQDETADFRYMDIEIHADVNDLTAIRKDLQRYDLDLVPVTRKVQVLVIRDR